MYRLDLTADDIFGMKRNYVINNMHNLKHIQSIQITSDDTLLLKLSELPNIKELIIILVSDEINLKKFLNLKKLYVEYVDGYYAQLNIVPPPNLKSLFLHRIYVNDLRDFVNLEELAIDSLGSTPLLYGNNLKTIHISGDYPQHDKIGVDNIPISVTEFHVDYQHINCICEGTFDIQKLIICFNSRYYNPGCISYDNIYNLSNLKHLSLVNNRESNLNVVDISKLPNTLEYLEISSIHVIKTGDIYLPNLTNLKLFDTNADVFDLHNLNVKKLSIRYKHKNAVIIPNNLEELNIYSMSFDWSIIPKSLKSLTISYCEKITGIVSFEGFDKLEYIKIHKSDFIIPADLYELINLKKIYLDNITSSYFDIQVGQLPNLKRLSTDIKLGPICHENIILNIIDPTCLTSKITTQKVYIGPMDVTDMAIVYTKDMFDPTQQKIKSARNIKFP